MPCSLTEGRMPALYAMSLFTDGCLKWNITKFHLRTDQANNSAWWIPKLSKNLTTMLTQDSGGGPWDIRRKTNTGWNLRVGLIFCVVHLLSFSFYDCILTNALSSDVCGAEIAKPSLILCYSKWYLLENQHLISHYPFPVFHLFLIVLLRMPGEMLAPFYGVGHSSTCCHYRHTFWTLEPRQRSH